MKEFTKEELQTFIKTLSKENRLIEGDLENQKQRKEEFKAGWNEALTGWKEATKGWGKAEDRIKELKAGIDNETRERHPYQNKY